MTKNTRVRCTAGPKPKKSEGWQAYLEYTKRQGTCECVKCRTDPATGEIYR